MRPLAYANLARLPTGLAVTFDASSQAAILPDTAQLCKSLPADTGIQVRHTLLRSDSGNDPSGNLVEPLG